MNEFDVKREDFNSEYEYRVECTKLSAYFLSLSEYYYNPDVNKYPLFENTHYFKECLNEITEPDKKRSRKLKNRDKSICCYYEDIYNELRCIRCGISKLVKAPINLPLEIMINILLATGAKYSLLLTISKDIRNLIGTLISEKNLVNLYGKFYRFYIDKYTYYKHGREAYPYCMTAYMEINTACSHIVFSGSGAVSLNHEIPLMSNVKGIVSTHRILMIRSKLYGLNNYDLIDKFIKNTFLYFMNNLESKYLLVYLYGSVYEIGLQHIPHEKRTIHELKDILEKHFGFSLEGEYEQKYVLKYF